MKKRENTPADAGQRNGRAPQPQERGACPPPCRPPSHTHFVFFLLGKGRDRHRYTPRVRQHVLFPPWSPSPGATGSRWGWGFVLSAGRDRGQCSAKPDRTAVGQGYRYLPPGAQFVLGPKRKAIILPSPS